MYFPVFPGKNCEYDSARAFEKEGAKSMIDVFSNQNHKIMNSIESIVQHIMNLKF